jgi:putative phosphoribosyl transferase
MNESRLPFRDRHAAGRALAEALEHYRGCRELLVLGLPRGGVPVAFEVAHALQAPLDIFVVRKLGFPGHEEYAIGAIASGGVRVMNPLAGVEVSPEALAEVIAREEDELVRRERVYRGERPAVSVRGRTVIVVDDGLATGSTMRAAVQSIRQQHPVRLVVAVPVGATETCEQLAGEADEVVCVATPSPFRAVGLWYREFAQTTDEEVHALLDQARREHALTVHG